jgi:hypothetical protein
MVKLFQLLEKRNASLHLHCVTSAKIKLLEPNDFQNILY